MSRIQTLLDEYSLSHQHPVNKLIHWIAVPAIVWSVLALLWWLPFPMAPDALPFPLNWAVLVVIAAQVYYFTLAPKLGAGLLFANLIALGLCMTLEQSTRVPLWQIAGAVFVVAWIAQFIGHAVEGKRPSFFKDLQFLLIGPAWLMAKVYRRLGFRLR